MLFYIESQFRKKEHQTPKEKNVPLEKCMHLTAEVNVCFRGTRLYFQNQIPHLYKIEEKLAKYRSKNGSK